MANLLLVEDYPDGADPEWVLERLREILGEETSWCKHALARNHLGLACDCRAQDCYQVCLEGGLSRALPINQGLYKVSQVSRDSLREAIRERAEQLGLKPPRKVPIAWFNDHGQVKYQDIMWVLDRAIQLARGEWSLNQRKPS